MIRRPETALFAVLTLVLLSASALVSAGDATADETASPAAKTVRLKGWITDEWCGAGNANAKGADCARHCNDKGAKLLLFSDGKLYGLSNQKLARQHIGYKVTVQGLLTGDDKHPEVAVESIRKTKSN